MTVNGQTEQVKSALYVETQDDEFGENVIVIYLFKDILTKFPQEPDFTVGIIIPKSLLGKTIDLTESTIPISYRIAGINTNTETEITFEYNNGKFETTNNASITAGTMTVTRSGNYFTVELSVTLSDGQYISAGWKGAAKKAEISE